MSPGTDAVSRFTVTRPVAILMVVVAAVVFGFLSLFRLPLNLMPELAYPTLTVRTEYPGAAPEEVENDVSRPLEEALGVVSGLRRISSISRAGVSDLVLEFGWGTDMSEAAQTTLERLDLVFLPEEATRPLILRFDPNLDPVMELSLSGEGDRFEGEEGLRRLRRIAELQVKRALEPVSGVAAARVRGGLEEEVQVALDAEALRRTGLSIQLVVDRLRQENINVAGGTLREGRIEYMVRTLNEYRDLREIEATVVATLEGREVRVEDLGEVRWDHRDREIVTRVDGRPSVQLDVFREADANMVALADRVRAVVGELDVEAERARLAGEQAGETRRRGPPGSLRASGLAVQLFRDEGAILEVVADRSQFIRSAIGEVRNAAIYGGLLAVAVLFLFLGKIRPTLIIAVSIPISVLVAFAPLNLLGVSLNLMSLGGLALGIGMLVDSSIVVLESIFRCREEGDDVRSAAARGTAEVRGAVVASTLTTIAVFFPMVFVEGVAGQVFGDLGLAVVSALLVALAVAVFFIPMVASRQLRGVEGEAAPGEPGDPRPRWRRPLLAWRLFREDLGRLRGWLGRRPARAWLGWPVAAAKGVGALPVLLYLCFRLLVAGAVELLLRGVLALLALGRFLLSRALGPAAARAGGWLARGPLALTSRGLEGLRRAYPGLLQWTLARPGTVVGIVAACLVVTWLGARALETELLPEVHQGEFTFEVALPVGTPLERTEEILSAVERSLLTEREGIRSLLVTVGYDRTDPQRSDEGEHTARFKLLLEPVRGEAMADQEARVAERLRRELARVPDLDARLVRPVMFTTGTPIEVEVEGEDLIQLRRFAERTRDALAALPELTDVETTLRPGAPEVQILYDREALARYGLNVGEVARLVRTKVQGAEASRFNLGDRRVPIRVRLAEADRETVEDVRELIINPGSERPIPVAAVADVVLGEGPSEVRRIDGRRVGLVQANLATGAALGTVAERVDGELRARVDWPEELSYVVSGQYRDWQESRRGLMLALALSIFLVYVIMAAQFESFLHPLVILISIPLAFLGTVLTLNALGISLSVVVFLGMIVLAGIVVNNAIVLIDYINTLRRRGMERVEAVVTAGTVRLRPILMTTATTVLGLTPMAVGLGDGAEIRKPLAIAVISGLLVSTLLTLIVMPSLYSFLEGLRERLLGPSIARQEDELALPVAQPGTAPR